MTVNNHQLFSILGISSLTILTVGALFIWRKQKTQKLNQLTPKKWVKVGKVKRLTVFPIKGCQGFEIQTAELTRLGLKCPGSSIRDRDFLLVDGNGKQLTMVNFPKMALINVNVDEDNRLTLTVPKFPNIIPLIFRSPKPDKTNQRTCTIKHDTQLKVLDCGDEVAKWFQGFLENDFVRLVYHHLNETQRTFLPFMFQCPQFRTLDLGSFQNATSYMMCAEESIQELNKRLEKKCTWKNFRPTILIDGVSEPFAEINWSYVKIGYEGNIILNVATPCHRCPVTTVDQDNGVMTGDGEPLKTLREMKLNEQVVDARLKDVLRNKGVMGLRLGLFLEKDEGSIVNVGDPIYAALL